MDYFESYTKGTEEMNALLWLMEKISQDLHWVGQKVRSVCK